MTADNVIKLHPKPLDVLCEAHPGLSPISTAALPAVTVASTIAAPQISHLSTASEDLRRPKMRMVAAAVADLGWPNGIPPAWLTRKQRNLVIRNACKERATVITGPDGEKLRNEPPGPRTIDRFFTGK
jgi:hypothetical protein